MGKVHVHVYPTQNMTRLHPASVNIAKLYIILFQVTPCPPGGSILFRTKPISTKHMPRLVSVCVFYILGGGYI